MNCGTYNILFCGRLEIGKGLCSLLALARKIEVIENFRLTIATPDSQNVEIFQYLNKTKILVGLKKEDMNAFYNSGDVMYFPSLYEGFEMVTTECLSAGVPIIGNNVGAIGDLYKLHQEGIALLHDNEDENILIIKMLADKYRNYDAKMRLHNSMVEKYSLKKYFKKLQTVWYN